ncbi:MAG: hypothetical protein CNLJKLNK_01309 [Holosporales bacterium]
MKRCRVLAVLLSLGVHTLFASAYYFWGQRGVHSSTTEEHRAPSSFAVGLVSMPQENKSTQQENVENVGVKPKAINPKKTAFGPSSASILKAQEADVSNRIIPSPFNEMPEYNDAALQDGVEARMICTLVLKADGCVRAIHIENADQYPAVLVSIVRQTLRRWRYSSTHALENVTIRVPIDFSLS